MIRVPLALLLAATLLCGLCGCSFFYSEEELSQILGASDPDDTENPSEDPAVDRMFSLSYYTEEELDPYTSSSRTNSELLRLCYSGLFALSSEYEAIPVMAGSYEADGNSVLIRLKEGIRFSDGALVTAEDCRASYDRAKVKGSVWREAFSYIRSYEVVDSQTFRVTFYNAFSPTQLNLLTVPVVRADMSDLAGYPIGCGRYRISTANGFDLVRADCGILSGEYGIEAISLLGIADREALIYNFNYGRLQAVCADLSLGTDEYRSDSELVTVPTNRFTFLVVNKSRPELANVNFSKGITYLLDRSALVEEACSSFATPVWYPYNPDWKTVKQAGFNPDIRSTVAAAEAFDAAGLLMEDTVRMYNKAPVTLRILVNRENASRVKAAEYIATALQGAGFTVELVQATWDEYRTAVRTLDFDLYLGEVNLPSNMDLSALYDYDLCNAGLQSFEYQNQLASLRAMGTEVLAGEVDPRTFVSEFQNVLPFIPLYYSLDALAVSMDVVGTFGASASELYWDIEHWSFS